MRDSRTLREKILSHSIEVEPLTQMHLNATGGKREERQTEREKARGGVLENGRKKCRKVESDNKAAGREK